MKIIWWLYL